MANKSLANFWIAVVAALLIGGLLTFTFFPRIAEKQVEVKVPASATQESCSAIGFVDSTSVPEVIQCGSTPSDYLSDSVKELLKYMDDEDLLVCSGDDYDADEVSVTKVYDSFSVVYSDEDEYTVEGKVKLNFKQDDEKRCRQTVDFNVFYEEDEDPAVTII